MNYEIIGNRLVLNGYTIEVVEEDIIHVYDTLGEYSYHPQGGYCGFLEVEELKGALLLRTKKYDITITEEFYICIQNHQGQTLFEQKEPTHILPNNVNYEILELEGHKASREASVKPITISSVLRDKEYIYAMGERAGFLNRRGYAYENWNTDDPTAHNEQYRTLYKTIPFYIVFHKEYQYGIFLDNHFHSYFDLGKTIPDELRMEADGGEYNYYFIGGDTLKDVVGGYARITGYTEMPQYFTLGHQQSRWSYMSKEEVLALARDFRRHDVKCDVIHLDIDYMDHYKVFTTNPETFSDFKSFIDELHSMGFHAVCIIDPGTKVEKGYSTYEELVEHRMVATLNGEIYINEVWPGESVYPTFNQKKTRDYWGTQIKKLTDLGVDGIWNDMNEPASFKGPLPLDVDFGGTAHKEIHNMYGHFMSMATYDGLRKYTEKRPFIITRACYSGTQKYSTIWTGDNQSLWHHLRANLVQLASLGLSGFSFTGSDCGGFGADCTPELMARWVEAACIYPLFRNHSAMGTRRQEPWAFDEETLRIYRKYVDLRYELIPYMYDMFYQETKTGIAPIRPLVLEYPKDSNTYELNDEVMLGDSILSAPVLDQGARKRLVYLPEGVWYDYFTEKKYTGGYHIVDADMDSLPFFVKEGGILPIGTFTSHTEVVKEMSFRLFPGEGSYLHYQDDGETYAYQKGKYNLYEITHKDNQVSVRLIHNGYTPYEKITFLYGMERIEIQSIK